MADMPYPYYRLQADGFNETGFVMQFQLDAAAGGPLEGMSVQGVLDHFKQYFSDGGAVTVRLSRSNVTTTDNL